MRFYAFPRPVIKMVFNEHEIFLQVLTELTAELILYNRRIESCGDKKG